jgi:hypothetical protein
MWQLVLKDLEQHARALTIFFISALGLPAGFYLVNPTGADNSGILGVTFGYMVFGGPTLFAFWLVGQEKMKGTLRLLRLLPISGGRVIAAKSLTIMALCLLINLMALIGVPLLLRLMGYGIEIPGWPIILWMCLAALFFGAMNVAIFTAFDHKIAMQIAYFGFFLVAVMVMAAEKFLKPRGVDVTLLLASLWGRWYFPYWGWSLALAFVAQLILFAGRLFERKEWSELEEG